MKNVIAQQVARLAFFCLTIAVLTACGAKRASVSSGGALTAKSQNELLADVVARGLKYKDISGKMNLELLAANAKSGMKTSAQAKVICDSIIQLSIRPLLGVEVLRVSITPGSLCIIDRMNKRYAMENIHELGQAHGAYFNYYNLQALLTNALFLPGQRQVDERNYGLFDVSEAANMYLLKTADKSGMLYHFAVDSSDRIASALLLSPDKGYTLQWSYSNFVNESGYIYPTRMEAKADIKERRFDLKIEYSKLDINTNISVDNTIPSKYAKVPLSELLKTLMKLM
ncbi:MAG: DUF4292 domain-containing protein [Prevotella sp.]|jgi:hypothetical protein|nr:DUF4292 domain-containing protein [Prevotella sp.]